MTTVVAAVIERDGHILIAQRKTGAWHALKWEFPGGKVEPEEAPEKAVLRELEEELGVQARIDHEIMRYEYQYPGRAPILLIFYRIADFTGEPRNFEFEQLRWERPQRLRDYDFLEGDVRFLERFSSKAGFSGPAGA
jgi:mutator protein MutT